MVGRPQVPQYILDEMIAAGQGGFCNIVCTQPRRIAVQSLHTLLEPISYCNSKQNGYHVSEV